MGVQMIDPFITTFVSFLMLMNMTDNQTILFVDESVEWWLEYEFHYERRSVKEVIETRNGDCTGRARLKKAILDEYGIKSRFVRGYADGYKHDWLEYNTDGKWWTNEHMYFEKLKRTGINGVW